MEAHPLHISHRPSANAYCHHSVDHGDHHESYRFSPDHTLASHRRCRERERLRRQNLLRATRPRRFLSAQIRGEEPQQRLLPAKQMENSYEHRHDLVPNSRWSGMQFRISARPGYDLDGTRGFELRRRTRRPRGEASAVWGGHCVRQNIVARAVLRKAEPMVLGCLARGAGPFGIIIDARQVGAPYAKRTACANKMARPATLGGPG